MTVMLRDSNGFYQVASYSTKAYKASDDGDLELAGNADNSVIDYIDIFGRIHQNVDHSTYLALATPIITDAQITITDQDGQDQSYLHLYKSGTIKTKSATIPPMVEYQNLQGMTIPYTDTVTYDQAGNKPIKPDTIIPNYPNGWTSLAYVEGRHAQMPPSGKLWFGLTQKSFEITDTTVKINDKYNDVIAADTTNILYDASGEPKTLTISTLLPVTNNQFFFNKDNGRILFFNQPVTGECLDKALKYMRLGDPLLDSLNDLLFDSNNEQLFTVF